MNWNSTGTLTAQGKLRVGQGGIGVFSQTAGVVIGENAGSLKYLGIGVNAGSQGTYNLNGSTLRPSNGGNRISAARGGGRWRTGELNVGDSVGSGLGSHRESNDDLYRPAAERV